MLCSIQDFFHSVWVCVHNRNIHNNVDTTTTHTNAETHNIILADWLGPSQENLTCILIEEPGPLCTNCAVPSAEWQQPFCIRERFLFNGLGTHCFTDCEKCDKKEQDTRELSLSCGTHCIPANVLQHIPPYFFFAQGRVYCPSSFLIHPRRTCCIPSLCCYSQTILLL